MPALVRSALTFAVVYILVVWLTPARWFPDGGIRREWKALVAVGFVTGLVLRWPELFVGLAMLRLGEIAWRRLRGSEGHRT